MQALIISDRDYMTAQYDELRARLCAYLEQKGYAVKEISVRQGEIAYCRGCFGCWIRTPGECVTKDDIAHINRTTMSSDAVFYLSPVMFGQFSANIKDVVDRWLPNMLPFFLKRKDGSTMHPSRYKRFPVHVEIGYGDAVTQETRNCLPILRVNIATTWKPSYTGRAWISKNISTAYGSPSQGGHYEP